MGESNGRGVDSKLWYYSVITLKCTQECVVCSTTVREGICTISQFLICTNIINILIRTTPHTSLILAPPLPSLSPEAADLESPSPCCASAEQETCECTCESPESVEGGKEEEEGGREEEE